MPSDVRQTYIDFLLGRRFPDVYWALTIDLDRGDDVPEPGRDMDRANKMFKYRDCLEDLSTAQLRAEYEEERTEEARESAVGSNEVLPTTKRNVELQEAANTLAKQWHTERKQFSKREICKALYDSPGFNRMFNCVETIEKIVRKQW